MRVDYADTNVETDQLHATMRVSFRLRAPQLARFRDLPGAAVGYHIFDAVTGILIVDGERVPLQSLDCDGTTTAPAELNIPLPPDRGRYRVIISLMQEGVCWFYERGWRFLRIDAAVDEGHLSLSAPRVMDLRRLKAEMLFRSFGRAFQYPFQTILRNHSLIRAMARRDILARYRGSFGGAFWTVLNPLLLMLTYFFVFGIVLRARFGNDPSRAGFVLYFLAGMLPWLPVSEALGRAPSVVLEHVNFVKKLVFPVEILPVNLVLAGLVTELFALGIFAVGLLMARGSVPLTVFWLPILLIPQILMTLGLSWFLAALGVYVRDLGQVNSYLLTLWFFLTPICYPVGSLPAPALHILSRNPVFVLVQGYRAILLEGRAPEFGSLWKLWLLSLALFILGHAWFYKLRRSFPDVI